MSEKSKNEMDGIYYQREDKEEKRELPPVFKKPMFVRGDSRVCPQALSGDAYHGCENRCIFCFCRELESTMFSAYFDNWTPDLIRPADLKYYEKMLKLAYSDKKTTNIVALGLRKGIAFNLGSRAELWQEKEFETETTLKILKLFKEYDHPIIMQTKAQWVGLDKYASLLSEMKAGVIVSIIGGGNIELLKLEPKAPPADQRWRLIRYLNEEWDIWTAARWEPILATINDDEKTLNNYGRRAKNNLAKHISFYNYRTSRRPMAKKLMEAAGFNYEKMWKFNDDVYWKEKGKKAFEIFKSYGVPCSTPDWLNFPFENDCISCCGIDKLFPKGYNKFTFQYACARIRDYGQVTWQDMLDADPILFDKKEFELVKHLWNEPDDHFFGMRDLYDEYRIDYAGEDSDGMKIWVKGQQEKKNLGDWF